MRRGLAAGFLSLVLAGAAPAFACNPQAPVPPAIESYGYGAAAAGFLLQESRSVVAARLTLKLDLELGDAPAARRTDYVFEVLEGWREPTARRLTISGHWVSCQLELRAGRVFLLYLEGERLLHAVPAAQLDFELPLLGEPDWFYDARGRLVVTGED